MLQPVLQLLDTAQAERVRGHEKVRRPRLFHKVHQQPDQIEVPEAIKVDVASLLQRGKRVLQQNADVGNQLFLSGFDLQYGRTGDRVPASQ